MTGTIELRASPWRRVLSLRKALSLQGPGRSASFGGLVLVATRGGDAVIELVPTEHDDVAFLSIAQRIMNGAIAKLRMGEAFVVHVDNWFDHKWLGWWSRKDEELRVPTFTPNRVFSEKHFVWTAETSVWESIALQKPLHVRQPGRPWLARPIDRFSESAAFIWYSGHAATNKVCSLMLYLSGAEGYSWYASFRKGEDWTVADELRDESCQYSRSAAVSWNWLKRKQMGQPSNKARSGEHRRLKNTRHVLHTAGVPPSCGVSSLPAIS
jgi:hypothetical protein